MLGGFKIKVQFSERQNKRDIVGDKPGYLVSEKTCTIVHVSLSSNCNVANETSIRELFEKYGKLRAWNISKEPPAVYVQYEKASQAQNAIKNLMNFDTTGENRKLIGDPKCNVNYYFEDKSGALTGLNGSVNGGVNMNSNVNMNANVNLNANKLNESANNSEFVNGNPSNPSSNLPNSENKNLSASTSASTSTLPLSLNLSNLAGNPLLLGENNPNLLLNLTNPLLSLNGLNALNPLNQLNQLNALSLLNQGTQSGIDTMTLSKIF